MQRNISNKTRKTKPLHQKGKDTERKNTTKNRGKTRTTREQATGGNTADTNKG